MSITFCVRAIIHTQNVINTFYVLFFCKKCFSIFFSHASMSRVMRRPAFAFAKKMGQISTFYLHLISAFFLSFFLFFFLFFASKAKHSLFFLKVKFQACNLLRNMCRNSTVCAKPHYANMAVQNTAIFHGCKNGNFQMKNAIFFLFLLKT